MAVATRLGGEALCFFVHVSSVLLSHSSFAFLFFLLSLLPTSLSLSLSLSLPLSFARSLILDCFHLNTRDNFVWPHWHRCVLTAVLFALQASEVKRKKAQDWNAKRVKTPRFGPSHTLVADITSICSSWNQGHCSGYGCCPQVLCFRYWQHVGVFQNSLFPHNSTVKFVEPAYGEMQSGCKAACMHTCCSKNPPPPPFPQPLLTLSRVHLHPVPGWR